MPCGRRFLPESFLIYDSPVSAAAEPESAELDLDRFRARARQGRWLAGGDELFEFRRTVRVDLIAAEPIEGEMLYSAPDESTRLVDYLNAPGRFLRLWAKERLYLINKAFVLRVVEMAPSP